MSPRKVPRNLSVSPCSTSGLSLGTPQTLLLPYKPDWLEATASASLIWSIPRLPIHLYVSLSFLFSWHFLRAVYHLTASINLLIWLKWHSQDRKTLFPNSWRGNFQLWATKNCLQLWAPLTVNYHEQVEGKGQKTGEIIQINQQLLKMLLGIHEGRVLMCLS